MNVVMTLLVRNEADIIDEHIAFHLSAGVDFIIAADNGSTDGTTEILERYEREGHLHRISVPDPFSQIEVVTRLARLAATQFAADWVINSDADEFWWVRTGTLDELLAAVPPRFGSVRGMWRNFVPRPSGQGSFAETMTIRSQNPVDELHPLNTHFKTVHRGSPDVEVGGGNHDVGGPGMTPLPGWYPIDVLHFPIRSLEQFERKFLRWWQITSIDGRATNPFYNLVDELHREGRVRELYDSFVVNDDQLEHGLKDGTLVEDTRLRDALRRLQQEDPSFRQSDSDIDGGYLVELGYIEETGAFARSQQRVEALETGISQLENRLTARISRRIQGDFARRASRSA